MIVNPAEGGSGIVFSRARPPILGFPAPHAPVGVTTGKAKAGFAPPHAVLLPMSGVLLLGIKVAFVGVLFTPAPHPGVGGVSSGGMA